ncbi:FAD-dependent oxidoreductase [Paenibacillus sp. P26]|nr:FAD-dependent oxidoreductase [Paenibacillus sp. P26]
MITKKVVILGGGVAGMSAAHELAERGFDVSVYEMRGLPGGKARSMPVPDSAEKGRKPLPGSMASAFFRDFISILSIPWNGFPTATTCAAWRTI